MALICGVACVVLQDAHSEAVVIIKWVYLGVPLVSSCGREVEEAGLGRGGLQL